MERARELIRPYLTREGIIGIYVVGSTTRPHRDELSDYDIELVVEDDVYARMSDEERHVYAFRDDEKRIVDHEFYHIPWSDFVALIESTQDLFHYPYQHAVVLHDPDGRIGPVVKKLAELPEAVRAERMRVHYLELRFALGRARKTTERGGGLNLALLYGDALSALAKLLFLGMRSWPATHHWCEQELRQLDVSRPLLRQVEAAFAAPDSDRFKELVETVNGWLDEQGGAFHRDVQALMAWAFYRSEGKQAFERWAGR
jgi:hypothetical protein